jgi:nicotinate-nucleotide adenylyltransferase
MIFDEKQIDALRERVRGSMSEWRFTHTAEVEKMAVRIGALYLPEKTDILRAAALLHDITKEKSTDEQLEILAMHGVEITALDRLSPKTLHARTAELIIADDYSEFASPELLLAVRRHTTGSADMTLLDSIIYLADYIDESRRFDDCVRLREYFWSAEPEKMDAEQRTEHLYRTLLKSFDMTLCALVAEGSPISPDTVEARNAVICRLKA